MADGRERNDTRALRGAQLLLVAAAGGLWGAARLPWVLIRSFDGLGQPKQITVTGASWSTALLPLALLCLAAAVAAMAVRGWQLRVLAVVLAAVSLACGYLAISMWVARDITLRALDIAEIPLTSLLGTDRRLTGAVLSLVAALGVLAAAVLLMRVAAHSAGRVTRYSAPAERRAAARDLEAGKPADPDGPQVSERMMWDALDEGRDPTGDPDDRAPGPDVEGR
ncbi:TIGR02234 family membrane protein [Mycolicibacter heraklionensis]|uniref:TIGR02234 family membrane protein n=1 Tax=Mycolicibacter heraklionensis TaxID=512402 RepID=A0A9X7ZFK8_9MYCO|nr:TIGR02234 family membrane protein [Mycolicibacter heraklionensis]QZA05823.1 TIGR02234 family membrane protein [Mycolicibacter heraklionensis]